jgi:hypothetical protein
MGSCVRRTTGQALLLRCSYRQLGWPSLFWNEASKPLKLYELVGTDPSRPFCWQTRMVLTQGVVGGSHPMVLHRPGAKVAWLSRLTYLAGNHAQNQQFVIARLRALSSRL